MNTHDTTFTIDRYLYLVVEKGTHIVQTQEGDSVRILVTDLLGRLPVAAAVKIEQEERAFRYGGSGTYYESGSIHPYDLQIVPKPPKSLGWIFLMGHPVHGVISTQPSTTRDEADFLAEEKSGWKRLACIEIFEGDGLDPQQL